MNKLEIMKQAVSDHFAAKEAHNAAREMPPPITDEMRKAYYAYNLAQDAAMTMLRDVLPLLEAAIKWDIMDSDTDMDESIMLCDALSAEVGKLLEDVQS